MKNLGWVLRDYVLERREDGASFEFPFHATSALLRVTASTGGEWDHVSVSTGGRPPLWEEMEFVKRLLFRDDETAMQLHAPPSDHTNLPHHLHLWRPQRLRIPRPPAWMVGPVGFHPRGKP